MREEREQIEYQGRKLGKRPRGQPNIYKTCTYGCRPLAETEECHEWWMWLLTLSELSPRPSAVGLGVGILGPKPRAVLPARFCVDSNALALDAFQTGCGVVSHICAGSKSSILPSEYPLMSPVVETIPVLRCRACERRT